MAVAFRSGADPGTSVSVLSRDVAVPAGAASGDVALVALGRWDAGGNNPTVTAPAGFTRKIQINSDDTLAKLEVWWKRLTGADSGTYSFSWPTTSQYATCEAALFTGCVATGDPISNTGSSSGQSATFASISATLNDTAGGLFWCCYNDYGGLHTPPTNFTEIADNDCGSSAYRIPGSSGSQTASGASYASTAGSNGALLVTLEPVVANTAIPGRPPLYVPRRRAANW